MGETSRSGNTGLLIVVGVVAVTLTGAVLLQTVLATWHVASLAALSTTLGESLADGLSEYVGEQIDSGWADAAIDPKGPLMSQRKILISHDINARTAKDVATRLFQLDAQDSSEPIDLYISTQGGWIDNAFTIIDAIRLIEAPVNTWAIGGCYSSGALILTAGTGMRYATENAIIMVHASLGDSEEPFSFDRLSLARYERVWTETADVPTDWFPMTDDASYYLSPAEALEFDVVDEIVPVWGAE